MTLHPVQAVETKKALIADETTSLPKPIERIDGVAKDMLLQAEPDEAQNPLLGDGKEKSDMDLEAGRVCAKKAKKTYLLELDLPLLGKFKIAPFYTDDDDDDDNAAKREPLGVKENAAFAVGLAAISVFSGYFYKKPFVSSAIAGGAMDICKTWYVYTEKSPWLRNSARAIAAITLIGAIALQYQAGDKDKLPLLLQIANVLPGVYPAMGFLNAEIDKAKPEEKLIALSERCGLPIAKKTAEALFSTFMAAAGLSLTVVPERNLCATGGIFFKTNVRTLSDILGKAIISLQNPCLKAVVGGATAISSVAAYTLALVGSPLGLYSSIWGKLAATALIVPPSDVASRTVKASIKADLKEKKAAKKAGIPLPEEEQGWAKTGLSILLHIAPVLGASAAAGLMADPAAPNLTPAVDPTATPGMTGDPASPDSQNSGVVAALFGDVVSFSKVATKRFDEKKVLALSALGVGATAVTYGLVESGKWALPKIVYSSSLVFGSLAAAYAIYHLKRLVRPPDMPNITDLEPAAAQIAG